jgi:hypothetical protein
MQAKLFRDGRSPNTERDKLQKLCLLPAKSLKRKQLFIFAAVLPSLEESDPLKNHYLPILPNRDQFSQFSIALDHFYNSHLLDLQQSFGAGCPFLQSSLHLTSHHHLSLQ